MVTKIFKLDFPNLIKLEKCLTESHFLYNTKFFQLAELKFYIGIRKERYSTLTPSGRSEYRPNKMIQKMSLNCTLGLGQIGF